MKRLYSAGRTSGLMARRSTHKRLFIYRECHPKGEVMYRALAKTGAVMVMGIVLLSNQGCNTKWPKSESKGEPGSGSVGTTLPPISGGNSSGDTKLPALSGEGSSGNTKLPALSGKSSSDDTKVPALSGESSSGELSGFSRNPSEERIAQVGDSGVLTPSEVGPRQRAVLTNEEQAAVEAGLQDVFFGYDQWALSDAGMEALDHGAAYLNNHPGAVLKIEGHCDERGTADYNMVLGEKRAKAARNYLADVRVKLQQVAIVSYGKERPFCLDRDESCYQQNRRDHMLLSISSP
jgi:peptidoglycan-associated lipoprotein